MTLAAAVLIVAVALYVFGFFAGYSVGKQVGRDDFYDEIKARFDEEKRKVENND